MAIIPTTRGNYQVRVRDCNNRFYPYKTFNTRKEARSYERQLCLKRDANEIAPSKLAKSITLNDYNKLWEKECRSKVSNGWIKTQAKNYKYHVAPIIGDRKLTSLTKRDVNHVFIQASNKGLSSQSIVHIFNLLNKMFGDAVDHFEFISTKPISLKMKPKVHSKERAYLNEVEAAKLITISKGTWLETPIRLGLFTGMRAGEMQALIWNYVNFKEQTISIRATYDRKEKVYKNHPKQKDWGQADMSDELTSYLKSIRGFGNDFVCKSPKGEPISYHSFLKGLKRLCREAGITVITPHELRHTCATLIRNATGSEGYAKDMLNQKCLRTTKRYIHGSNKNLKHAANTFANVIKEKVSQIN